MPRRLSKSKQLPALFLPLALFLSWAACLVLCDENAAHHDDLNLSAVIESASDCFDLNAAPENCQTSAVAVILQERQTVKTAAFSAASSPPVQYRAASPAATIRLPEIKQNSPPEIFPAQLFVRFCALRI